MTIVCFDSSAIVKVLVEEEGSGLAALLWDDAELVVLSHLAHPEVSAALSAAVRSHRLGPAGERHARRSWEQLRSGVRVVEVTADLADEAARLAQDHVLGGGDAVHLASALALQEGGVVLAAWDARLRAAALEAGVAVVPATAG